MKLKFEMPTDMLQRGNVIKIIPRDNQEGILFIRELHETTAICEMLIPRSGYLFRIKPHEMNPVPLSCEWLTKAGFTRSNASPDEWSQNREAISYTIKSEGGHFYTAGGRILKTVHELQNEFRYATGSELFIFNL